MVSNCTIWPSELDQNGVTCFSASHTIPGETKESPLSIFFGTARHFFRIFFRNFFPSKGPHCIFLMFCNRMDVGKSQRVPPFSFFRHCEIFSRKKNFFNFFMFCDRMDVEKPQRVPPFSFSAL